MRRAIVDSSVAIAWVLGDEPAHAPAVRFRDLIVTGEIEPVVAGHFSFEVRSALVRAARRSRIVWESVADRVRAIEALEPEVHPLLGDDELLLALSRQLRVSWADAHWIGLAATLDLPLVTADERMAANVPDSAAVVVSVSGIGA
ncbi:MAG: type II toxin-antitoxin system VapC family toxin [Chloroflexi bacterium]|nr:type II toxin-antitoxin system VapC family toxin [Chloroflexota bacterium]